MQHKKFSRFSLEEVAPSFLTVFTAFKFFISIVDFAYALVCCDCLIVVQKVLLINISSEIRVSKNSII